VANTQDAIDFVHRVNRDRTVQERVSALKPRDWTGFFALAEELGYAVDLEAFYNGCLSDHVVYFCPALSAFAGHLHTYKM
jgi:hypothetical protein